jgi:5-carboxymethyl-2-hydroxymuconate isomerase
MPHFIIDCSENILNIANPDELMLEIHDLAESTNIFSKGDIKVRLNPYKHYNVGNTKNDFIHVFAYIMQGRNSEEKANLSKLIVCKLKTLFPQVPILSMNVMDFEKDTYCNKGMIDA